MVYKIIGKKIVATRYGQSTKLIDCVFFNMNCLIMLDISDMVMA
jgi:hypothetical protein